jgi:hypothetical protein
MSSVSGSSVTGAKRPDFPMVEWDRPPWNRWSFQHIGEILPTTPVKAGAAHAFETSLQDFSALAFDDHGQRSTIRDWLGTSFTDGFIVVHKNRIVFEDYLNSMGPKTLHLAQSVSKSIATSAFGVMVGRGVIDPARLITDYLPELNATAYRGATVQHALDNIRANSVHPGLMPAMLTSGRTADRRFASSKVESFVPGPDRTDLQAQGKRAEALELCRKALAGFHRVLGEDHPNTQNALRLYNQLQ